MKHTFSKSGQLLLWPFYLSPVYTSFLVMCEMVINHIISMADELNQPCVWVAPTLLSVESPSLRANWSKVRATLMWSKRSQLNVFIVQGPWWERSYRGLIPRLLLCKACLIEHFCRGDTQTPKIVPAFYLYYINNIYTIIIISILW